MLDGYQRRWRKEPASRSYANHVLPLLLLFVGEVPRDPCRGVGQCRRVNASRLDVRGCQGQSDNRQQSTPHNPPTAGKQRHLAEGRSQATRARRRSILFHNIFARTCDCRPKNCLCVPSDGPSCTGRSGYRTSNRSDRRAAIMNAGEGIHNRGGSAWRDESGAFGAVAPHLPEGHQGQQSPDEMPRHHRRSVPGAS